MGPPPTREYCERCANDEHIYCAVRKVGKGCSVAWCPLVLKKPVSHTVGALKVCARHKTCSNDTAAGESTSSRSARVRYSSLDAPPLTLTLTLSPVPRPACIGGSHGLPLLSFMNTNNIRVDAWAHETAPRLASRDYYCVLSAAETDRAQRVLRQRGLAAALPAPSSSCQLRIWTLGGARLLHLARLPIEAAGAGGGEGGGEPTLPEHTLRPLRLGRREHAEVVARREAGGGPVGPRVDPDGVRVHK